MDAPDFPSEHFRLPNGARAMLLPRPRSPTLAVQLLLRAGSRHDGTHPGLAHLVEHLVFRAPTPPRADLYAAVESLGGEVGGGTTRDYTSFEIVVGAPHAAIITTEAELGANNCAGSVGFERLTPKARSPVTRGSRRMVMLKFLMVSPGPKTREPVAAT